MSVLEIFFILFCVCVRSSSSFVTLPKQLNLALYDGCYGSVNKAECYSVSNGLFKSGLHAAVQHLIGLLRDIHNALEGTELQNKTVTV